MPNIKTFGDAVDYYSKCLLAERPMAKSWAGQTQRIRTEFGHLALEDVGDFLESWRQIFMTVPYKGKMRLPASVNRPTSRIKAIFNRLVKAGIISENPITKSRFPKYKENRRNRYLSAAERVKIFESIRANRPCIEPMIRYMMAVPCRLSELLMTKREAYNDETRTIYIPTSKSRIPIYKPVPEDMLDYFRSIPLDCPWLFYWIDHNGNYRPLASIQKWWSECRRLSGVTDIRIHDLRHVAATDLLIAGNPVRMIMDIAGWKTDMFSVYWHNNSLLSAQRIVFKPIAAT